MATAKLDAGTILDWSSFHEQCKAVFGFPDFYGKNLDAWIDCLSYLRDDDAMSSFRLQPDEVLVIELQNADSLRRQAPQIIEELEFCIAAVNDRYTDYGEKPALQLVLR